MRLSPLSPTCAATAARAVQPLRGDPTAARGMCPGEAKHPPACGRPCCLIFPPAPSQGLLGNLSLDSSPLSNWLIYPLAIDTAIQQGWPHAALPKSSRGSRAGPAFYTGTFETPGIAWDTFVKFPGWSKVKRCIAGRRGEGGEAQSSDLSPSSRASCG